MQLKTFTITIFLINRGRAKCQLLFIKGNNFNSLRLLTYICIVMLFTSCSLFDNEDPIPGFLILDNPTLTAGPNQGANTHKITDAWVFDGGNFLGIFPMPARVPVILDGTEKSFTIFAGIRNNGVAENSLRYPFYQPVIYNANLAEREEREVELNFQYIENAVFDFIEEFEGNHIFIEDPNTSDGAGTEIVVQSDVVLSGFSSGQIIFDTDTSSFERTTLVTYDRENNAGSSTFLEIDYKCDIPFLAGWITYRNNFIERDYNVLVAPSEEWNKIYIDVSTPIAAIEIDRYTVALASAITEGNPIPSNIFIDNVKLVHF